VHVYMSLSIYLPHASICEEVHQLLVFTMHTNHTNQMEADYM